MKQVKSAKVPEDKRPSYAVLRGKRLYRAYRKTILALAKK
jgi:hypothetical protein